MSAPVPVPMPQNRPVSLRLLCEYIIESNGWASTNISVRAWSGASGSENREIYANGGPNSPDWPEPGTNAYLVSRLLPLARLFGDLVPSLAASAIVESASLAAVERIETILVRLAVDISVGGPSRRERPVSAIFVAYENMPPYWVLIRQSRTGNDYLPEHWPDWTGDIPERLDVKAGRFRRTIDSPGWQGLRGRLALQYRPAIGALLAAVPHGKLV